MPKSLFLIKLQALSEIFKSSIFYANLWWLLLWLCNLNINAIDENVITQQSTVCSTVFLFYCMKFAQLVSTKCHLWLFFYCHSMTLTFGHATNSLPYPAYHYFLRTIFLRLLCRSISGCSKLTVQIFLCRGNLLVLCQFKEVCCLLCWSLPSNCDAIISQSQKI